MTAADDAHPLARAAALSRADGGWSGPPLELVASGRVTRLRCEEPQLWVMIDDEDGSIWDRWTADDPAVTCVRAPRALALEGPAAIFDHLAAVISAPGTGGTP